MGLVQQGGLEVRRTAPHRVVEEGGLTDDAHRRRD
jgi:hypothetical protein